jgi:hypothetical protein
MLFVPSHLKFVLCLALLFVFCEPTTAQDGCVAIDKSKPPLFISFAQMDDKALEGSKYVKGVLLRLNNNSNCVISFSAESGSGARASAWIMRNGKMVPRASVPPGSLDFGQRVNLLYLTKYANKPYLQQGGFGGDVLDTVYLNGGDHIFFSVPLTNFKRGGEILLPYKYMWDEGERGQIIVKEGGNIRGRYETVEHYLRFVPDQLPGGTMK